MSNSRNIIYPAMKQLIGRMTDNDLLVLSGFITSLYEEADAIAHALEALPEQVPNFPSGKAVQAIQHSAQTLSRNISGVSLQITKQLVLNREKIISTH